MEVNLLVMFPPLNPEGDPGRPRVIPNYSSFYSS